MGIFTIGTAGCGKTLFTASLYEWLHGKGKSVGILNLDPAVKYLPYKADVDVRAYVDVDKIIEKYGLGPNGALLAATDIAASRIDEINKSFSELNYEYIICDTPGQMELFAFRASGLILFEGLNLDRKAVIFIFDGPFITNPINYVSTLFLAGAIYNRFSVPQLNVLSKVDLLPKQTVAEILRWSTDPGRLESQIGKEAKSQVYLLTRDLYHALSRLRVDFSLIACSARTLENFLTVEGAIERLMSKEDHE